MPALDHGHQHRNRTILITSKCLPVVVLLILTCGFVNVGASDLARNEARIQINNGLISVALDQAPLSEVLQIIANQTNIQIELGASADRLITKHFSDVPFEEGLRRLLRPYNHVIVYKNSGSPAAGERVEKIVIMGKPEDRGKPAEIPNAKASVEQLPAIATPSAQIEPESETSVASYAEKLKAEDPSVRMESVIEMGEKYHSKALGYLDDLLANDSSPDVRVTVAKTIGNMQSEEGIPALTKGLQDPDDEVRTVVLDALGVIGTPAVLPALKTALNDSNNDIRDKAASLIDEIEKTQ